MEHWLSQLGAGTKHLTERVAEYPSAVHEQQLYYSYEPSSHGYGASKHHGGGGGGGGHKGNAAMSALTLLAFLFFLHILQQCLKEHMTAMTAPQVMVVSAGRHNPNDQSIAKTIDKLDNQHGDFKNKMAPDDEFLTRIATAEHTPKVSRYTNKIQTNKSSIFGDYVRATDDK